MIKYKLKDFVEEYPDSNTLPKWGRVTYIQFFKKEYDDYPSISCIEGELYYREDEHNGRVLGVNDWVANLEIDIDFNDKHHVAYMEDECRVWIELDEEWMLNH